MIIWLLCLAGLTLSITCVLICVIGNNEFIPIIDDKKQVEVDRKQYILNADNTSVVTDYGNVMEQLHPESDGIVYAYSITDRITIEL